MKFDLQNDCELENYFSVKGVAPIEIMIVTFMNAIHLSGSLSFYLSLFPLNPPFSYIIKVLVQSV